jgi:hypothetical protein
MKSLNFLFLTTCVLLLNTTYSQTIRRVNNNPGVTGVNVYTTAQAAHDAAVANDILIIEPSVSTYGNLTLTKPLKIYGNGYFLTTNTELKVDQRSSLLANIEFDTGSGGSEISGISWDFAGGSGISIYGVSNIKISGNNIAFIQLYNYNKATTINSNISNITISKNVLNGWYYIGPITANSTASYTISNVLITNNILTYPGSSPYFNGIMATSATGIQNWLVRNNTFTTNLNTSLTNSVFENNVLVNGGTLTFTNVTASYNISEGSYPTGGIGNQLLYNVSAQLIGSGSGITTDESYQLKSGSPLKTAGSAGTEVGAFGGATPYVVSGIPAIPSITGFINTATGSNSVPLQVTISVKSNN